VFSSPAVVNGVVFVGSGDGKLYACAAAGNTNCSGTPKTCTPLWTAPTGGAVQSSPSVANGVVYVGSGDGKLYAFGFDKVPPTTSVVVPHNGDILAGTTPLLATACDDVSVSTVDFHITGDNLNDAVVATGTLTRYGWFAQWDTAQVPNGVYTLQSVAHDAAGNVGRSTDVDITVQN
jgi:hypothetical protein